MCWLEALVVHSHAEKAHKGTGDLDPYLHSNLNKPVWKQELDSKWPAAQAMAGGEILLLFTAT